MHCPECGKENAGEAKSCVSCGGKFTGITLLLDSISESPTVADAGSPAPEGQKKLRDSTRAAVTDAHSKHSIGDLRTMVEEQGTAMPASERFDIIAPSGSNEMGAIHEAKDRKLDRAVALRCLRPGPAAGKEAMEQLWNEARLLASLDHPNILQIYDILEDGWNFWIVMEHVRGGTLQARLNAQGAFGADPALGMILQIADALSLAHKKGVVHHDIKPANIFLADRNLPKLANFSIECGHEESRHSEDSIADAESPALFLSPERAAGSAADFRSDIYSLGATLYIMVTGEAPQQPDLGRLDGNLQTVIGRCLEENPEKRYPTAEAMLEALRTMSGSESPSYNEIENLRRGIRKDVRKCRRSGGLSHMKSVCDTRLPVWRRAAELGMPEGQWLLGSCYKNGAGVAQDPAEAQSWFRKAAVQDYAYGQFHLGICYAKGRGVDKDMAEATRWFRKAAGGKCASAQFNLGICYECGYGVEKDRKKALMWYRKAAKNGNPEAKKKLGSDDA